MSEPSVRLRRPRSALVVALVTVLLACLTAGLASAPRAAASPPGDKDVTATLFQWRFDSIARACTETLGPKGYGYVETSPPQESIQGPQWWITYQPVSYRIAGRLGDEASFKNMVDTCHAAGVKVIVDAVVNHMSAGSGTGTGGTRYGKYDYPGHYQVQDFHSCRSEISDYRDRYDVQNCELLGLSDLDTGSEYVRSEIAEYMNRLIAIGVDGFRIDAAKHVAAADLEAIKAKLTDPDVFWVNEAIYSAGEAVRPSEYTGSGDVDLFQGAFDLKRVFGSEKLAYLENWGSSWGTGYLPSDKARTFVDNWDTERNGSTLSYEDGSTYTLANVFLLAWPYGAPNVHSGYAFSDTDAGPPNGGRVDACYQDGWKCQHAWPQIANMVGFRSAVSGTSVTNWWSNGDDAIAFGRGGQGYVVINREGGPVSRTFQTSLPAGTYCDVQHGDPVAGGCTGPAYTVGQDGRFTATVGAGDAVALYVGAGTSNGDDHSASGALFAVNAATTRGQNIYVVGDHAALGEWDPDEALPMSSGDYPVWKLDVELPAGTSFQYKYIRKEPGGGVTWESGGNRTATVPADGKVTLSDAWRN